MVTPQPRRSTPSRMRGLLALARAVRPLGADRRSRLTLVTVTLLLPLKSRLLPSRPVRFRLQKFGRTIQCAVRDRSDLLTLKEIFVLDAYDVAALTSRPPETILDLGANVGWASLWFALRYPNARIHAFEPSADTFKLLSSNVREVSAITTHRLALGAHEGQVEFFTAPESFKSGLRSVEGARREVVAVSTLDGVMSDLDIDRVDVLKLDIEGAEWDVLRVFDHLDDVGVIVGELHVDLMDVGRERFLSLFDGWTVKMERQHMSAIPQAEYYTFSASRQERRIA